MASRHGVSVPFSGGALRLEQLKVMFLELDSDGSGELTLEELKLAPELVMQQLKEVAGTEEPGVSLVLRATSRFQP